jgi:hypothetical protein
MTGTGAGGFAVDPEQLRAGADKLKKLTEKAAEIAAKGGDVNPDLMALGALGEVIEFIFRDTAGKIHEHLNEVHKGLDQRAHAWEHTGLTYEAVERHHADQIRHFNRQSLEDALREAR